MPRVKELAFTILRFALLIYILVLCFSAGVYFVFFTLCLDLMDLAIGMASLGLAILLVRELLEER